MKTSWLEIAQQLPLNGKTQTVCPENCGSGEKLSVNHSVKSYWCNCYRCGFNDSHWKGQQTLAELKKIQGLNDAAKNIQLTLELPDDYSTEIPILGRMWLYKAGITEPTWRSHNIGYSEHLERVILPIHDSQGNLIWYQCRAIHKGQEPKYLQPARDRSSIVLEVGFEREDIQRVVLVEDILSAIRVGKHTPTVSLLGTKITTAQAAKLAKYPRVTTWLDSDRAGRIGAYNIRRTLGLVTEVDNIVTDKDPKELSDKQIKEYLNVETI